MLVPTRKRTSDMLSEGLTTPRCAPEMGRRPIRFGLIWSPDLAEVLTGVRRIGSQEPKKIQGEWIDAGCFARGSDRRDAGQGVSSDHRAGSPLSLVDSRRCGPAEGW